MVFNPTKCQLLSIGRICLHPPVFQISGVQLVCVPHLRYLGVWLDTTLIMAGAHPTCLPACPSLDYASFIVVLGLSGDSTPRSSVCLVEAEVFPTLFYATPVWCTVVCHLSHLDPLGSSHPTFCHRLLRVIADCFSLCLPNDSWLPPGKVPALPKGTLWNTTFERLTYGEDLMTTRQPSCLEPT